MKLTKEQRGRLIKGFEENHPCLDIQFILNEFERILEDTPDEEYRLQWNYTKTKGIGEYISLAGEIGRGQISQTKVLRDGLNIDLDENGRPLGIEILPDTPERGSGECGCEKSIELTRKTHEEKHARLLEEERLPEEVMGFANLAEAADAFNSLVEYLRTRGK